jgi:hypothetical protein
MDFLIKELNISFSYNELFSYLLTLEKNFKGYKWTSDLADDVDGASKHKIDGVYGWGIQSNLSDLERPCPPYNVHKLGGDDYKDTKLVFDFAEKIRNKFSYSRQVSIAAHPPGTKINLHTDTDSYLKVHVPILSNDRAYFFFEKEKFVMQPGKMYLVNTQKLHGTVNEGHTIRTHLFFKIPIDKIDEILGTTTL